MNLACSFRCVLLTTVLASSSGLSLGQEAGNSSVIPTAVSEAVQDNCIACHDQASREGDLDLESLSFDLADPETFHKWQYAFERVHRGEMPPDDDLDPDLRKQFLKSLEQSLHDFDAGRIAAEGRVPARRLTNQQYEQTVHELLGIRIPLADALPAESLAGGFDTVAASQQISDHLMAAYLTAADVALESAFDVALNPPNAHSVRLDWKDLRRDEKKKDRQPEGRPKHKDIVSWSTYQNFYGRLPATTAKQIGHYRIRFRAEAVNPPGDGRIWCTLRSGACTGKESTLYWIDKFEVTNNPSEHEFTAWIREGHMLQLRPEGSGLKNAKPKGGKGSIDGPAGVIETMGIPGVAVKWIQLERIDPDVDRVRDLLFDKLPIEKRSRGSASKKSKGKQGSFSIASTNPQQDLRRLTQRFASWAFRRPASLAGIETHVALAEKTLAETGSLAEALKTAYRTVLCSPRFLYLYEATGQLDSWALAQRLSYCLWGSPPDLELFQAASSGKLTDPAELKRQTERLLDDPRSEFFIHNFTDQWLQLYELDSTTPDGQLYPEYDDVLHHSLCEETHRFIGELLEKDLSVVNLVDSDFTFLNSRLARHYKIDWDNDLGMQKVRLKPNDHRGGVVTHASVLKVTANGTTTSPIVRGVWMLERIMGQHIPPPPANVPAVEPDIRGAVTIRDQLDKHRDLESCAVCHVKIDPPGFALESYDVIGGFRDRYRKTPEDGKRRWKPGPEVDPSSELTTGENFSDLVGLKKILRKQPDQLAHSFASQFVTYATGGKPTFADREALDQIVQSTKNDDYGLRSIVHAVIQSELFRNK